MKKVIKESIKWHSVKNKYPITNEAVLAQSNDGILRAYWDKQKQRWCSIDDGSIYGRALNEDTHVYYWSYYPKGVNIYDLEKDKPKKKCLHNKEIEEIWKDEEILYICKECSEIIGSEENTK